MHTHSKQTMSQYDKMIETPIPPLICSLAIPTIISMLVTSIYNMADTYFVSQLGTSAAGAVGIVFSLMAVIQAVGFTLGMGSGSLSSRLLGQKRQEEVNQICSSGLFAAAALGLTITVLGSLFLNPLMNLLGATDTILPFAKSYARYILFGAPFMCSSFVMNNVLRSEGKAAYSMVGIASGGILNILLDPIFIFIFHLGIAGAAIATLISQCISFAIMLSFFLRGKSTIRLHIRYISKNPNVYKEIIQTGFPSFCRQGLASIASIALNVNAAIYGDAAVAAMSITSKIFMMVFSVMLGFGQGFQPVVGYNYGAQKYRRVKQATIFTFLTGTGMMTVLGLLGFILAPWLIRLFRRDDAQVIAIGIIAIRAQALALPLMPLVTVMNMVFQVIGRSKKATLLSACRQGIFFLPMIVLLPIWLELTGIEIAQALADLCTFLLSIPFAVLFIRELNDRIATADSL